MSLFSAPSLARRAAHVSIRSASASSASSSSASTSSAYSNIMSPLASYSYSSALRHLSSRSSSSTIAAAASLLSSSSPCSTTITATRLQHHHSYSTHSSQQQPRPTDPDPSFQDIDPLRMIKTELASLRSSVSRLLGSGHPALDTIAKYYFQAEGKHIRPQIVLLMARATNGLSPLWPTLQQRAQNEPGMSVGKPISPVHILNDHNPHASQPTQSEQGPTYLLPTQRRLAEITEMIHVASLLHDDVIDEASLRRSAPSAPASFGNKLSILAGDFLLGRASVALARLRDNEVVELLATVIANLVEGEVMQLKGAPGPAAPAPIQGADEEVQESLAAFEQAIYATDHSPTATNSNPLSSFLSFDPMAPLPSSSSTSYPPGGPTQEQFA
ncbi:hypothetical protein CF326_g9318, partial [Tilletia indica]